MVNKIKKDTLLAIVAEWIEEIEVPPLIPRQCPDIGLEPLKRVLAIVGPRRAGKTYFMYQLIQSLLQSGRYTKQDIRRLIGDAGIVRNRLKIESAIKNAKAFLEVQQEYGSFDSYIWCFVDGKPKKNGFKTLKDIPAKTKESEALSKDLKQRGFTFVGPTICYAIMQAIGMVNDHLITCFRYKQV